MSKGLSKLWVKFTMIMSLMSLLTPVIAQTEDCILAAPYELKAMGFAANAEVCMSEDIATEADIFPVETEIPSAATRSSNLIITPTLTPVTGIDYRTVSRTDFDCRLSSGTNCGWCGGRANPQDLSRAGTESFFDAHVELPADSTIDGIRYFFDDRHASADASLFVFESCNAAFGPSVTTWTTFVSVNPATTGSSGAQSGFVNLNRPVNNRDCTYTVRVRLDAASDLLAVQKIRIQLQL